MHQDRDYHQEASSRGSQCEESHSRMSYQHPHTPQTYDTSPTYGLTTVLCLIQRQFNSYMDKLFWDGDAGVVTMSDQCCFLQLIFVLISIHTTIFCRLWDLIVSVSSVVVVAIQFIHFAFGQLLNIASTRNIRDVRAKSAVFCLQGIILSMVACPLVMIYVPIIRYGWYLFTSAIHIVVTTLTNNS